MKHTANETSTATLTRFIKALDKRQPVTITYTKADGTQTIRTIELYDITTSAAGDILLKAMDRETGERRTFRLDRLVSHTTHRTTYTVPRPTAEQPATPELATVTVLYTEEPAMTPGQQFAKRMRNNLGIGTRTRRYRKGADLHATILECITNNAWYPGYYTGDRAELFSLAYGPWMAYDKHIAGHRASASVTAHVNALSPWQFCALLGEMVDAGIANAGQGERFFTALARRLYEQAA